MPTVGFEPTIPASEWPQAHALHRATTGIITTTTTTTTNATKKAKTVLFHCKQAQRGGRIIALSITDPGARRGG